MRTPRDSVLTSAPGRPAASALMPSALAQRRPRDAERAEPPCGVLLPGGRGARRRARPTTSAPCRARRGPWRARAAAAASRRRRRPARGASWCTSRPGRRAAPRSGGPPTAAAPGPAGCCAAGRTARAARGSGRASGARCAGSGTRGRTGRPRSRTTARPWSAERCGPLEEQRRRLVVGEHLLVQVLDEVAAGALGLAGTAAARRRASAGCGSRRTGTPPTSGPSVSASRVPSGEVGGRAHASASLPPRRPAAAAQPSAGWSLVRCSSQSRSVRIRA